MFKEKAAKWIPMQTNKWIPLWSQISNVDQLQEILWKLFYRAGEYIGVGNEQFKDIKYKTITRLATFCFSCLVWGKRLSSKVSTFLTVREQQQTEGWTNRKERKPKETASIICLAVVWLSKGKQWKQDCMKLQPELLRCIISKMLLSSCYWNAKCGVACCKEE